MAVVNRYSTAYPDPATSKLPNPLYRMANVYSMLAMAAVVSGDSATSVLYLGKLPAGAIILPRSTLHHSAITGVTSLHLGMTRPDAAANNNLANALDVSSAGTKSLLAAVALADLHKPVWQLAGFGADPSGELELIATLNQAATAAGTLLAEIVYAHLGP